jgi:hypothetical protein
LADAGAALPQSQLERDLASIWECVLGVERVGIHDNFFDLGGHSLLMAQAHSRLQELLGREVQIVDLFRYPTIHLLSQFLAGKQTGRETAPTAAQQGQERGQLMREALNAQRERVQRSLQQARGNAPRRGGAK